MATPMEADLSTQFFNLNHDMNVLGSNEAQQ